jgi:hypothetical protein
VQIKAASQRASLLMGILAPLQFLAWRRSKALSSELVEEADPDRDDSNPDRSTMPHSCLKLVTLIFGVVVLSVAVGADPENRPPVGARKAFELIASKASRGPSQSAVGNDSIRIAANRLTHMYLCLEGNSRLPQGAGLIARERQVRNRITAL